MQHDGNNEHGAPVRRYLVLAHHEGGHLPVLEEAVRLMSESPCTFHVLVPTTPARDAWTWTDDDASALARTRLQAALDDLRGIGAEATGEIAAPELGDAVRDALAHGRFDGIIISTIPDGLLERLGLDWVHRLESKIDIPITHLFARHALRA